jgi:hypothetical protein
LLDDLVWVVRGDAVEVGRALDADVAAAVLDEGEQSVALGLGERGVGDVIQHDVVAREVDEVDAVRRQRHVRRVAERGRYLRAALLEAMPGEAVAAYR